MKRRIFAQLTGGIGWGFAAAADYLHGRGGERMVNNFASQPLALVRRGAGFQYVCLSPVKKNQLLHAVLLLHAALLLHNIQRGM
jgi:hypothetical protein